MLEPGLVGTAELTVAPEHTAERMGSGRAPVLSTPILVALLEAAAVACIERRLPDGQESLGVRIDVEHLAPTPVGLRVSARAALEKIDGRTLHFAVEARDERELVGTGRHVRVLVDSARFRARARAKA